MQVSLASLLTVLLATQPGDLGVFRWKSGSGTCLDLCKTALGGRDAGAWSVRHRSHVRIYSSFPPQIFADREKRNDGLSFSVLLIIHDTVCRLYKVPLSLSVPNPPSNKMTNVKLNPERWILNGKIRGQICLNHHLLLIRKSMAFDARVHVCLWSWECDNDNVDWKIALFKSYLLFVVWSLIHTTQWKVCSIT